MGCTTTYTLERNQPCIKGSKTHRETSEKEHNLPRTDREAGRPYRQVGTEIYHGESERRWDEAVVRGVSVQDDGDWEESCEVQDVETELREDRRIWRPKDDTTEYAPWVGCSGSPTR